MNHLITEMKQLIARYETTEPDDIAEIGTLEEKTEIRWIEDEMVPRGTMRWSESYAEQERFVGPNCSVVDKHGVEKYAQVPPYYRVRVISRPKPAPKPASREKTLVEAIELAQQISDKQEQNIRQDRRRHLADVDEAIGSLKREVPSLPKPAPKPTENDKIAKQLKEAGAIDIETASVLVDRIVTSNAGIDIRNAIKVLKQDKSYLFAPKPTALEQLPEELASMVKLFAGSRNPNVLAQMILDNRAAIFAAGEDPNNGKGVKTDKGSLLGAADIATGDTDDSVHFYSEIPESTGEDLTSEDAITIARELVARALALQANKGAER